MVKYNPKGCTRHSPDNWCGSLENRLGKISVRPREVHSTHHIRVSTHTVKEEDNKTTDGGLIFYFLPSIHMTPKDIVLIMP